MHPDLKFVGETIHGSQIRFSSLSWLWLFIVVGLLNPLDCPHHMRMEEHSLYREGVVLDRPSGKKKKGSYADCGMRKVNFC